MTDQIQGRDTIYALSSGSLPSGVAVIRISGRGVGAVLESMIGRVPEARYARFSAIRNAAHEVLDHGLCLYFPGPASFTGEDCAELQIHGGRAAVQATLNALSAFQDTRPAEQGEFTKRAFLNGKIDLTEAEALADLIAAETEAQRRFALASGTARHQELYAGWRQRIIKARALIEAELDFSDEEDVPGSVADVIWQDITALGMAIEAHAASYRDAEIIREGFRVVILGAPNAGKSSLLNALARRDVAIVTDEPGTTRDILEVALDIHGAKIVISDTAGIRADPGRIEAMGIARALDKAREADLILLLEDGTAPVPIADAPSGIPQLRIANKGDILGETASRHAREEVYDFVISAKTGAGLEQILAEIGKLAATHTSHAGEILPFRVRHVEQLKIAGAHINETLTMVDAPIELCAEELRLASNALGRIAGVVDVEDLLDTIFSQFCIGK